MSKFPSESRNFTRLIELRLHAVSSRNMYSEHGFDALIRALFEHVCQALIVESYWTPGSAHCHALSAMIRQSSRALCVSTTSPVVRIFVSQSPSCSTARMNSSFTRTEL